jgi:SAM-dependent methyltransferase
MHLMGTAGAIKKLKKALPLPLRRRFRRAWTITGRLNDLLSNRNRMIPWKQYALSVGGGDFEKVGQEYFGYLVRLGGLEPHHHLLDVGCGIGRMAVPLTGYLSEGAYTGCDIVEQSIRWCRRRIASRYPNFSFDHVDVYNRHYNPGGNLKASDFDFPYADASFDLVLLVSVFTHMLPEDMENYTFEVARVLKPGGRCLITFFVLDDENTRLVEEGKSDLDYKFQFEGFRSVEPEEVETSIAYEEPLIRGLYKRAGLRILEPIHYGTWSRRSGGLAYQDIVVASRSV